MLIQDQNTQMYGRAGTPSCNMLRDIFARSWFTRIWTAQELSLGTDARILCGEYEISWPRLQYAMTWLAQIEKNTTPDIANDLQLLNRIHVYQHLRGIVQPTLSPHLVMERQKDRRISKLLALVHPLQSWNPRDKIYGLYGCFTALGYRDLPLVDYDRPLSRVYSDFARLAMPREQSLDLLYSLGHKPTIPDLESWSPDWSTCGNHWRHGWPERVAASKASKPRFYFVGDSELHAAGVIIDTINHRPSSNLPDAQDLSPGEPVHGFPRPDDVLRQMKQSVQTWQEWVVLVTQLGNGAYPPGAAWEAFGRTLVQNGVIGLLPHYTIADDVLAQVGTWVSIMMSSYPGIIDVEQEVLDLIDEAVKIALERPAIQMLYFHEGVDPESIIATPAWRSMIAANYCTARDLHRWIFKMTTGRTFFTTENGYMGTGSELAQAGDQIALISGMRFPMIVRRNDGDGMYGFVCPAYVHGLMDGEKWPEDESTGVEILVFT